MRVIVSLLFAAVPLSAAENHIKHTIQNIEGWTVHVDPQLLKGKDAETGRMVLRILSNHLFKLTLALSEDQVKKLRQVPIFIDLNHPLGNLQYHPSVGWLKSNGHDPAMEKAVHIPQARRLIHLQKTNGQPWVILHEMAHAYHDRILGFNEKTIRNAYDNAKKSGLYQSVLLIHGQKRRHYALTNHKEYFAELTESYFGTNDFFPFVYSELRDYDAQGFAMLQKIWGKRR